MKRVSGTIAAVLLAFSGVAQADSVYQWGHWMEDDIAKRILLGADPSQITEPTAAGPGGTTVQPVINNTVSNPIITQEGMPKLGVVVPVPTTPSTPRVDPGGSGGFVPADGPPK